MTRLLRENGIEPTIVELNMDTVRQLRQEGIAAIYGDATQRETLEGAGVAGAGSLILTSAGMGSSAEVIRMARELNPGIRVLARAAYLRDLPALRKAGADIVFTGEGEVALALTEAILHRLGATPEQIDRERYRAHTRAVRRIAHDRDGDRVTSGRMEMGRRRLALPRCSCRRVPRRGHRASPRGRSPPRPKPVPSDSATPSSGQLVGELSEPDGRFPFDNFLSNETTIQSVIPALKASGPAGRRVSRRRPGAELHVHRRARAEDRVHHRHPARRTCSST